MTLHDAYHAVFGQHLTLYPPDHATRRREIVRAALNWRVAGDNDVRTKKEIKFFLKKLKIKVEEK